MSHFVDQHGLWTPEQHKQAESLLRQLDADGIEVLRFVFPDQHGLLRGKTLTTAAAKPALFDGVNLTSTLLLKDTSHRTVFPVFADAGLPLAGMRGGADFKAVADPATFRVLPWAEKTGWVLCDAHTPDGQPHPLATRPILKRALQQLATQGLDLVAGLEVEFHVFKLEDASLQLSDAALPGQPGTPPRVSLLSQGHQYLTELRADPCDALLSLLRQQLQLLGLPLASLEIEFGPSQFELTFAPGSGMAAADQMVLLRSAIKQICQRHGYHATFMCRPRLPGVMSSGWHLHQSLARQGDGGNAFMAEVKAATADQATGPTATAGSDPSVEGHPLSALGMHYLAGLKQHASGCAALACPTINGYRRYRPNSLAPDRAAWARDNRAAMLRVLGGPGQAASRIENRMGEPAANPYLYLASQVFSGLHGMQAQLDAGPSADAPYQSEAALLPRSLPEALQALREDQQLVQALGANFVDYWCHIKQAEIDRFNLEVSEWEQREYFELF